MTRGKLRPASREDMDRDFESLVRCDVVEEDVDATVDGGVRRGVERARESRWDAERIQATAATASPERFQREIREVVNDA